MASAFFDRDFQGRVRAHVRAYGRSIDWVAWTHLIVALSMLIASLGVQRACVKTLHGAGLFLIVPLIALLQVGLLIKLFMIHHDLMHGSYFSTRALRRPIAVLVGSIVHVSPTVWKREHDRHHRTSNNLDEPQDGQTASLTLAAFHALPRWQARLYRLVSNPWVLFGIVPLIYFLVFMRIRARWYENLVVAALWYGLWRWELITVYLVPMLLAPSLGFVVFHAQHTFDGAYRRHRDAWDPFDNAMRGSSLLVLPDPPVLGRLIRFFAHGVAYHHVHHLNPRIAGYRLGRCHADAGALFDACPRVTLGRALSTLTYALYDEDTGHFVTPCESHTIV